MEAHIHVRYTDADQTGRFRVKRWCGDHQEVALTSDMMENLLLDKIQQYLTRRDISAALQVAGNLLFQTMPPTAQIGKWIEETERLRTVACSEGGVGFLHIGRERCHRIGAGKLPPSGPTSGA